MTPFLLFDAYGTLIELDDFYGRLERGFAVQGVPLPPEVVRHAAHREMRYYITHALRGRDLASWSALRDECADELAAGVREQGQRLDLPHAATLQVLAEAIVFRVFPDVRETLAALRRRGVALGVLSNWDYQLAANLAGVGLAEHFEFIVSSSQSGFEKPAPEFFAYGVERARQVRPGVAAGDCSYIGDHYEKDVLGARAAGLRPLWLVRDRRDLASGETHEAADEVPRLDSLRDLLGLF